MFLKHDLSIMIHRGARKKWKLLFIFTFLFIYPLKLLFLCMFYNAFNSICTQTDICDRLHKYRSVHIGSVSTSFVLIKIYDKMLNDCCCRSFISQEMKSKQPVSPHNIWMIHCLMVTLLVCLSYCSWLSVLIRLYNFLFSLYFLLSVPYVNFHFLYG